MSAPQSAAGGRRASRRAPRTWLHPTNSLVKGSIVYQVKFWGYVEVPQAKGAAVVKEAIDILAKEVEKVKKQGGKTLKVNIAISYKAIRTQDAKTKAVLHTHSLGGVTYAGDDKTNKNVFAYIAQDETSNKFFCFAYQAAGVAPQISLTVAQAFDVAFKEFNKTLGADKAKIRKKIDTAQKAVETAATGEGPSAEETAAEQKKQATQAPHTPAPAATPATSAPEAATAPISVAKVPVAMPTLQQAQSESIDVPNGDQGFFEPFEMSVGSDALAMPVFGPGIDDIDDAVKMIEEQVGGLLEGFRAGFTLDDEQS